MIHKKDLVFVGKAVPNNLKGIIKNLSNAEMIEILIDSDVNMCRDLQCGEPMELHVYMCRICLKLEDECGYNISIEGVEL